MIWILTLLIQIWFGFEIISIFLKKRHNIWYKISFVCPFGFLISSLIYFFFSTFLGNNIYHLIFHLIILTIISSYFFTNRFKFENFTFYRPSNLTLIVFLFSLIISILIFPKFYFPLPRYMNTVCINFKKKKKNIFFFFFFLNFKKNN